MSHWQKLQSLQQQPYHHQQQKQKQQQGGQRDVAAAPGYSSSLRDAALLLYRVHWQDQLVLDDEEQVTTDLEVREGAERGAWQAGSGASCIGECAWPMTWHACLPAAAVLY